MEECHFLNYVYFCLVLCLLGLTIACTTDNFAKQIITGNEHACAVLNNRSTKCWGQNFLGQLGIGDTFNYGIDPDEMGDFLPFVNLGVN